MENRAYDRNMTIGNILEQTRDLEGTAFVCRGRRLSYGEFHAITDRIATGLKRKGIMKHDVVAVGMPKSEYLYTAVFGVIKADAVYLIENMEWPEKRRSYVRADAGVKFCITEENYGELLSGGGKADSGVPGEYFEPSCAEDVCAIYYTSGSCGNPKGVMLTHRNIVSAFYPREGNLVSYTGSRNCSAVLDLLNPGYIASLHNMAVSLFSGKKHVLVTADELTDTETIVKIRAEENTDFMVVVPSMMEAFLSNENFRKALCRMKVITLVGEAVPQRLLDQLTEVTTDKTAIINNYGSTEVPGILNAFLHKGEVLMGYPLPGIRLHLLDEYGNEVCGGEDGEICAGGDTMSKGYIGLAEMNREKFTVLPNGEKVYHTGDRGRKGKNGEITFAGRMDRMVKLNGVRIELPEIEQAMRRLPWFSSAAVKVCMTENDSQILTAFYTTEKDPEDREIREKLGEQLPDNMIPAIFVRLAKMPLTNRGKADYAKLALPAAFGRKAGFEAPTGDKETAICHAFEKVLKVKPVGRTDSFYELGGDSILGLMVLSELREQGYVASMKELFHYPDARELARCLKKTDREVIPAEDGTELIGSVLCLASERQEAEKILSEEKNPENTEAVFALTGTEKIYYELPEAVKKSNGYYLDIQFWVRKGITEEGFKKKAERFVCSHPVLRSAFRSEGLSRPFQLIFKKTEPCCFYKDIRGKYDPEKMTAEEFWEKLDSETASFEGTPLFVSGCFRLTDRTSILLIHTFHSMFDGLSTSHFIQYFLSDTEEIGEDRYLFYRRWLYRKQKYEREEAEAFWKKYLKEPQLGMLPFKTFSSCEARVKTRKIELDREKTEKLKNVCISLKVTLETCLQYLYGLSLMNVLKKDESVYLATFSGRTEEIGGTDNTVGMLIKQVPVRQKREESLEEYRDQLWKVQKYSYLEPELIWKAALGRAFIPPLDGGITGDIFSQQIEELIEERHRYDAFIYGNDIHMEDRTLVLRFKFNPVLTDENAVDALCGNMEQLIRLFSCRQNVSERRQGMEGKKKISLITPVCNTSPEFLQRAAESVRSQSYGYDNIEWIMVLHNCRKDYEERIHERFDADRNIKIMELHNACHSPSAPRNKGLEEACGEYVMFLDSDDELCRDCMEKAESSMRETGVDLAFLGASILSDEKEYRKYEEIQIQSEFSDSEDRIVMKKNDCRIPLLLGYFGIPVWGKIYRTDFLRKNGILFNEEMEVGEDIAFNLECYGKADAIYKSEATKAYIYHLHGGSQSFSRLESEQAFDYMRVMEETILREGEKYHVNTNIFLWSYLTGEVNKLYARGMSAEVRKQHYEKLAEIAGYLKPIEPIPGWNETEIRKTEQTVKNAFPFTRKL